MSTFIIDCYDSIYKTQCIDSFFSKLYCMFRDRTVIKNIRIEKKNGIVDLYHPYETTSNYLIDSKLKSHFFDIGQTKSLFFFKLENNYNVQNIKISDILPRGVEITQRAIEYYSLLKKISGVSTSDQFYKIYCSQKI